MKDFTYSAIPSVIGWNWTLHFPEGTPPGVHVSGYSLTLNGALRRMKREAALRSGPIHRGTL